MPTTRTALPLSSQVCRGEQLPVERVLSEETGVVTALVNPASEMAYVEYDPALTDPEALFAVLQRAGFAPPIAKCRSSRGLQRPESGKRPGAHTLSIV